MGKCLLICHVLYTAIVLALSVSLISLGIKGKVESESSHHSGPDYYIGSFIVAPVFALVGILTALFLGLIYKFGENMCTSCAKLWSVLCQFLGFAACITGLVFVIRFGIQNCNSRNPRSENCSYNKNIDVNYNIAVASLVLILLLFLSLCCSCCLCLFDEDSFQKEEHESAFRRGQRSEIAKCETGLQKCNGQKQEPETQTEHTRKFKGLQRQDQELQLQIRSLESTVAPIEINSESIRVEINSDSNGVETNSDSNGLEGSYLSTLKYRVQRLKRKNQQLKDQIKRNENIPREQYRKVETPSLPLLIQLQSQIQQIQHNQEIQMNVIQSNIQSRMPDFQQPSCSGVNPSAPPYEDRPDQPPSYRTAVYGYEK